MFKRLRSPETLTRSLWGAAAVLAAGALATGRLLRERKPTPPAVDYITMEWPNTTAMLPPKYHASIKARESVEAIAAGRTVAVMASPVTRKEYLDLQATGSKLAYAAKDDRGEWVVGQSYEVFEECYPRGDDPTEGLYLGVSLGVRGADFALGYVDETGTFQSIPTYHSATLREDVFATAYAGRGLRQRL